MSFYTTSTLPGNIKRVSPLKPAAATHSHRFSFFAEPILFQTNHPALLDIAQSAFGRFPPAEGEPLVLQMFVGERELVGTQGNSGELNEQSTVNSDQLPVTRDQSPVSQSLNLSVSQSPRIKPTIHHQGHLFSINFGSENSLVVDLRGGYSMGFVSAAALHDPDFIRYNLIETAAQAMSSYGRGYVAIHAAAVVKDNQAFLLTGPSGVGKSTLAYACIRQGFQALAEDVVQVKIQPNGLQFWGVPWKTHLLPDAVRFFPELNGLVPQQQSNGEWKLEVDLETLHPNSTISHVPSARLVFLQRAQPGEPPHLEQLTPEQTRERFEVVWAWETGWKEEYDRQLRHLSEVGSYQLFISSSPDETAHLLAEIMNRGDAENAEKRK